MCEPGRSKFQRRGLHVAPDQQLALGFLVNNVLGQLKQELSSGALVHVCGFNLANTVQFGLDVSLPDVSVCLLFATEYAIA